MRLIEVVSDSSPETDLTQLIHEALKPLSRQEQYLSLIELFSAAIVSKQQLVDSVTICWEYFLENRIWNAYFHTLTSFEGFFALSAQLSEMVEEGTRSRKRTVEYLDRIAAIWGPIEAALPEDLIQIPRISYHLSRLLFQLASRLPLDEAIKCLQREVQARCRNHRRAGQPATHITLADVQAVLSDTLRYPVGGGSIEVHVPVLSPKERLAYHNPSALPSDEGPSPADGSGNARHNPRCYCPEEFTDRLAYLMSNPPMSARLQAFKFGVALSLNCLCWDHIRSFFSRAVGLMSNNARGRARFEERIMALYFHLEAGGNYLNFVASKSKEGWFNATVRAFTVCDAWRPFRYPQVVRTEPVINHIEILHRFTADPNAYASFIETGNVIITDFFDYLNTKEMREHIDNEFKVYRYHFRASEGVATKGFLRNCFYSLMQQACRMDPGYYLVNVAARPDHQWRLISYPYVAKGTEPGEVTGFNHLDINLDKYFSDEKIGFNQLTSSVSFDDEDEDNCTCLVPKFMMHAKEWNERVKQRLHISSLTGRTTEALKNYTNEDAELYGKVKPFPCPAFSIRLTLPTIIHGSSPRATIIRRVIYPWFTAIQADHETLEMPDQHTWSELSQFHRDLEAPERGVAGERVGKDRPRYRFPAAIKLESVSALSDALVGRRRWTDPEVLYERDILFGSDTVASMALVIQIRTRLYDALIRGYGKMEDIERYSFGDLSYFLHPEGQPLTPGPIEAGEEHMSVDID